MEGWNNSGFVLPYVNVRIHFQIQMSKKVLCESVEHCNEIPLWLFCINSLLCCVQDLTFFGTLTVFLLSIVFRKL